LARTRYRSLDFAPLPPLPSLRPSLHRHASTIHQKRLSVLSSCPVSAMATSGDSNQRPAPISGLPQPSFNTLQFGTMSDSQLRQTINQLSHAASGTQYQPYAAPTPQRTAGKCPPPLRKVSPPLFITALGTQPTKKTLPTGQHPRLLHRAPPRGAAAI
jgi:hypothetical protein